MFLSFLINSTLWNLVFEHSSMSLQLAPSCDNSCPLGHSQWNEPGVLIHLPPRQRPGVFSHSSISMHTCKENLRYNRGVGSGYAGWAFAVHLRLIPHLHHGCHFKSRITLAGKTSRDIYASSVSANIRQNRAFVNIAASNSMLIQSVSLIADKVIYYRVLSSGRFQNNMLLHLVTKSGSMTLPFN